MYVQLKSDQYVQKKKQIKSKTKQNTNHFHKMRFLLQPDF